jgi:hypothetical protein
MQYTLDCAAVGLVLLTEQQMSQSSSWLPSRSGVASSCATHLDACRSIDLLRASFPCRAGLLRRAIGQSHALHLCKLADGQYLLDKRARQRSSDHQASRAAGVRLVTEPRVE